MPNSPTITVEGADLKFTWADISVGARVDKIRLGRDGDLIAEVAWYVDDLTGKYHHLHGAKLNLSSTRERDSLVRVLSDRTQAQEIDWATVVEQLSELTKQHHAEGEPFTTIGGTESTAAHTYLVERLLEERQITVWYGEGGSLKSYLALAAALSVQGFYEYLGLGVEQGNVLYLDYETDAEEMNDRTRRLARGLGMTSLEYPVIHYRRQTLPIASDVTGLRRFIAQKEIKLVIVDSLGLACGGEPESAEVALRMYAALRQLGCTVLGINHVAKSQAEVKGKRQPFGSVYHVNIPRSTWEVRATSETESATVSVGLYHRKSNNGRLWKPMGFQVTFGPDATSIRLTEIMDTPELAEGVSLTDQITAALRGGAQSVASLSEILDGPTEDTIRKVLHRGKDSRFVKVLGKWGIKAN